MTLARALSFSLLLAAAPFAWAAPAPVRVQLKAEAVVEGRDVTLGDLVDVADATAPQWPAVRQTVLATAPRPGYSLHLSQREVARLLREAGHPEIVLGGAEASTIETRAAPFDTAAITGAAENYLRTALQANAPSLELIPEALPPVKLPGGNVTVQVRTQRIDRLRGRMTVSVDVLVDGSFYRTMQVPFQVHARQSALVAKTDLQKGQVLACANLDMQERDLAQLDATPVTDCTRQGLRLRRNLAAGEVLQANMLEPVPAVSEGDTVALQLNDGAVALETRAVALLEGNVGQRIPVKATGSEESVLALIVAPDVVKVSGK
ncbi:MAG: flagellar basal body P-ring formation protein FlgA [Burkholderiales bacterium]|nr:flagellar basal body P-ring formation protein FlgA [Burkholderiales bacterium]